VRENIKKFTCKFRKIVFESVTMLFFNVMLLLKHCHMTQVQY